MLRASPSPSWTLWRRSTDWRCLCWSHLVSLLGKCPYQLFRPVLLGISLNKTLKIKILNPLVFLAGFFDIIGYFLPVSSGSREVDLAPLRIPYGHIYQVPRGYKARWNRCFCLTFASSSSEQHGNFLGILINRYYYRLYGDSDWATILSFGNVCWQPNHKYHLKRPSVGRVAILLLSCNDDDNISGIPGPRSSNEELQLHIAIYNCISQHCINSSFFWSQIPWLVRRGDVLLTPETRAAAPSGARLPCKMINGPSAFWMQWHDDFLTWCPDPQGICRSFLLLSYQYKWCDPRAGSHSAKRYFITAGAPPTS